MRDLLELLRPGYQTEEKAFFYAEIREGQLRHFGYYLNGQPLGTYINLDAQRRIGRVSQALSTFPEDHPPYGKDEEIDAAELEADEKAFWEWAKVWISTIYQEREPKSVSLQCGFCSKRYGEVRRIFTGPKSTICNECLELCIETMWEERSREEAPG
ncbi:MAG TPA: ClpX C4-type zinc finger protein [Candidatus Xenobia bacterium]|jgi:hypothetical protein